MPARPILIVEDDPPTLAFIQAALSQAGYATCAARSGPAALRLFAATEPALVLLDLTLLGDMDGLVVLAALRQRSQTPVMILTGECSDARLARSFDLGADNYVVKPVTRLELVARVRAQLRGRSPVVLPQAEGVFRYGAVMIDLNQAVVRRADGRCFKLPGLERRVVARLLATPGQLVSRQELMDGVWATGEVVMRWDDARTLLNCIYRLRRKLDADSGKSLITTVASQGFLIAPPDADACISFGWRETRAASAHSP